MSSLVEVAHIDELHPGQRKLCDVAGHRLALFNIDDRIYAIDNHCPHRGGPVGAGKLDATTVTCPWHGWQFDVATGRCLIGDGSPLRPYATRVTDGVIYVDLHAPAATTEDVFHYVVRYGALGHVGRFGSIDKIECQRGDRVVVHSDRGVELGELLLAPDDQSSEHARASPAGEFLRVMTDADAQRERDLGDEHLDVLEQAKDLIAEQRINVSPMDAESLFDGETIVIYFLGDPTEQLGPIAVELSDDVGHRRVHFQSIATRD